MIDRPDQTEPHDLPSPAKRRGRRWRLPLIGGAALLAVGGVLVAVSPSAQASVPFTLESMDGSGNNTAHPTWGQAGLPYARVGTAHYADGISTSVRAGIAALGKDIDAAIVQLGDMPAVSAPLLDRLIAAFSPVEGRSICVPTVRGKRGNPVLWDRRFFAEIGTLSGDSGAKHLIGEHTDLVCEVEMSGEAALTDIDTPEALAAFIAEGVAQGAS